MPTGIASIPKIKELWTRILMSMGLLAVYRLGVAVPSPGIDAAALASFFQAQQNTLFGLFNLFSGGALERLSIFALGIMPYVSSSIILQLLTVVFPYLSNLQKDEHGRRKLTQFTRYGTILLSAAQSLGIAFWMESMRDPMVVLSPGWRFRLMTMITLTAGTAFIMWLGEQITEKGIGNGISLIIFAGIVARLPAAIFNTFKMIQTDQLSIFMMLLIVLLMSAVIYAIVFVEGGQRRIVYQQPKQVRGRRIIGGQTQVLPLKVNTAGVIPPIFASSLLMFPLTIANFAGGSADNAFFRWVTENFQPSAAVYNICYIAGIIFFCFFYTAIQFDANKVAMDLKRTGGYIAGIRPGKNTAVYIERVLNRITLGGAIYIALICVLPSFLVTQFNVPFYYGGTSLLIVVGVALDTMQQIQGHLIDRDYEGIGKGIKIRGRRGYI